MGIKITYLKAVLVFSVAVNILWMYKFSSLRKNGRAAGNSTMNTQGTNASGVETTTMSDVGKVIEEKQPCQQPELVGPLKIDYAQMNASFYSLNTTFDSNLLFQPECKAKLTVAIIVPFRDREEHLHYLLGHLHPMLKRQLLSYQIFVVEQVGNYTFNKGRLMNTGFDFVKKMFGIQFDCVIFQDVDMLPENDQNIYGCGVGTNKVHHLSCSVNKFDYRPLCCGMTVGGVLSFTTEQFQKVNGFPNDYWGWGGEDDDMNLRIKKKQLSVMRPTFALCRYHMIKHDRDKLNTHNSPEKIEANLESTNHQFDNNGLSNLNTSILQVRRFPLYVRLFVDVGTL